MPRERVFRYAYDDTRKLTMTFRAEDWQGAKADVLFRLLDTGLPDFSPDHLVEVTGENQEAGPSSTPKY